MSRIPKGIRGRKAQAGAGLCVCAGLQLHMAKSRESEKIFGKYRDGIIFISAILGFVLLFLAAVNFITPSALNTPTDLSATSSPPVAQLGNEKSNGDPLSQIDGPAQESQNPPANPPSQDNSGYSAIVNEWRNRVAKVICGWYYPDGSVEETVQGSGLLANVRNIGLVLVTNKHIVESSAGSSAARCRVGVPKAGSRTISNNNATDTPFLLASSGRDWAYIQLGPKYAQTDNPAAPDSFDTIVSTPLNICAKEASEGDKVIVLGYPAIGTQGGITVTDGIVSGIENDFYVTSAKIDHGNSGGAAILLKDDCYLGIPTWAEGGELESLGRILKSSFVFGN